MDILEAAKNAERCQRNWSHENVTPEDLDYIIKVATAVPTKQNLPNYRLIAITKQKINQRIAEEAAYQEQDVKKYMHGMQNHQLLAPVVLIWLGNTDWPGINISVPEQIFKEDLYNSVGISSGAAAIAANMLGYKTGFCKCMQPDKLHNILEEHGIVRRENQDFVCALGIGKPIPNLEHFNGVYKGATTHIHPTIEKTIEVSIIPDK
jgi:nitroreductase